MEWPNSPIFPAVAPTTSSTRVFRVRDQMIGIQLSPRERQDGMLFYEKKVIRCHPVMYEWLDSVAQVAKKAQRFNPTLAQLASPNCVQSSAPVGKTLVIVPKITAPKFPTQFRLIQEKELSLICAYSEMEFDGTIHLSILQAKEAALSIIEDDVSHGQYNGVIDSFLALSFIGPQFNGQEHVYVSSANLRRELPDRRKPAITHFHMDRNVMYPQGVKRTIRQILVSAPLASDGSSATQGQQPTLDLSMYDNVNMTLNNTCPICFIEGCVDDHDIISMNTTFPDMSFDLVNDDGRLSEGRSRNLNNCNALLLLENLVERLCKEENVARDCKVSGAASACYQSGITNRSGRMYDKMELKPIVIESGNVEHVIATPIRAGNQQGISGSVSDVRATMAMGSRAASQTMTDGTMDVQACSDDAGGYLQQNVAADLEGTGDLQGISSTAASAKQSTQQELLEQMVIGSLLRLEMRSVMKNQLDQMRRSVFPIDSKKLLPEAALLSGSVMEILWSYVQPFLRVYCKPGDLSSQQLDGFITLVMNHLVLELSHKVLFDVDNGTMTVNDALGVAAAQKISYDLSDPAIYSNKSLHISLTDVDDDEQREEHPPAACDNGLKRKNSTTAQSCDPQPKRQRILSLDIDTADVSFLDFSSNDGGKVDVSTVAANNLWADDDDVFEGQGDNSCDVAENVTSRGQSSSDNTGDGVAGDSNRDDEGSDSTVELHYESAASVGSVADASAETVNVGDDDDRNLNMSSEDNNDFENLTLRLFDSEDEDGVLGSAQATGNSTDMQYDDDGYGSQQLRNQCDDDSHGTAHKVDEDSNNAGDGLDLEVDNDGDGNGSLSSAESEQDSDDEDDDVPRHITALQMIELIMRQSRRLTNRIAKELDVLWNVVKKNK